MAYGSSVRQTNNRPPAIFLQADPALTGRLTHEGSQPQGRNNSLLLALTMTATTSNSLRPQTGPQWDFLASRADIAIMGGAAGGGKTFGLLLGAARHISVPNYAGLLLRRETTQIRNPGGLWHESMDLYPRLGGVPRQSPALEWRWPAVPSSIQFNHLQRESTVLSYHGAQVGFLGFDELTTFEESQFWYLLSRNRTMAAHQPRVRATCNPDAD